MRIMRGERGMMRAEMSVAYCNTEYRKAVRDQTNAPATWSRKGAPLPKVLYDSSTGTKSTKLFLNTNVRDIVLNKYDSICGYKFLL